MNMFAILLALLLTPIPAQAATGPQDAALDGARSLGQTASLKEILRLFRQPTDEDEEFLAQLQALGEEMLVLESTTLSTYRARGVFAIFDVREQATLADFDHAVTEFLADPEPRLTSSSQDVRRVWARILFDVRLRIRIELFDGWHAEAEDVNDGLALLRANTDGWVRTSEEEAQAIAKRVDLAAALLRARIKDLGALREMPGEDPEVRDEDVDRLLQAIQLEAGPEREDLLDELFLEADRAVRRMRGLLFSSRLRVDAHTWLVWRDDSESKAQRLLAEARAWDPASEAAKDAPREVKIKKKTTRRRESLARSLAGLAHDPFDDELAYQAGIMSEFVAGTLESLDFYDRFLALRGIRVHLDRNWPDELTEEEEHAIFQIQQFEQQARDNPVDGGGE